jgi:hypothetical protein
VPSRCGYAKVGPVSNIYLIDAHSTNVSGKHSRVTHATSSGPVFALKILIGSKCAIRMFKLSAGVNINIVIT